MIGDDELMQLIDKVSSEYVGDIDKLSQAVGMLVLSRLFGYRVMRLVAPRGLWSFANKLFGDVRELSVERGKYYSKSVGMRVIDTAIESVEEYWEYVNRVRPLPNAEKRTII